MELRSVQRVLLCVGGTAIVLGGCGGARSPTSPGETVLDIAGTWDVTFDGTIVQRNDGGAVGESQRDSFVYSLQQAGTSITGQMILNQGRSSEVRIPLTGTLAANRFDYRVDFSVGGCSLSVRAETTLGAGGAAFTGSQSQSNCEGRAEGRVNGTRR